MADHHHHHHHHHHTMRSLGNVGKACKSFVLKCYHEKKILSPKRSKSKDNNPTSVEDDFQEKKKVDKNEMHMRYSGDLSYLGNNTKNNTSSNNKPSSSSSFSGPLPGPRRLNPSPLSRSASKRTQTPTRGSSFSRTFSSRGSVGDHGVDKIGSLSRSVSTGRRGSTSIMYSNSNGVVKPPAMEMTLECTLEELCFGCVKEVKIIRDTLTNDGDVIQEEEVLTIKVKAGWTKGTKITFQGMGNKAPGANPSDVIFTVAVKEHLLYRREGDDLQMEVKLPMVKALTGGSLPIPILSSGKKKNMDITLDDIIYPGYKTVIPGQGMPNTQNQGNRGSLTVTFQVEFPKELTDAQRFDMVNILQDSS